MKGFLIFSNIQPLIDKDVTNELISTVWGEHFASWWDGVVIAAGQDIVGWFHSLRNFRILPTHYQLPVESDLISRAYLALTTGLGSNFILFQLSIFLSAALCGVLVLVAQLFSRDMVQELEKKSPYECGFFPFDSATRLPFDVHFYVVGIMFLVFDVELVILTTIIVLAAVMPWAALTNVAVFIIVLTVGFIYEWACGALRWDAKTPEPLTLAASANSAFFVLPLLTVCEDLALSTIYNSFSVYLLILQAVELALPELFPWCVLGLLTRHFTDRTSTDLDVVKVGKPVKGHTQARRRTRSHRRHLGPRAGLIRSWRPRHWILRHRVEYWKHLWSREPSYRYQLFMAYNTVPSPIERAPGHLGRRIRSFFSTVLLPSLHYHTARLHRWPLVFVLSFFVIPAVTIPWYWVVDDYDIAFHDLTRLYEDVQQFASTQLNLYTHLHSWLRRLLIVLLLYPTAIARSLLTWHYEIHIWQWDGPYMFLAGTAVAWIAWEFMPGGSWTAKFYAWEDAREESVDTDRFYRYEKPAAVQTEVYWAHFTIPHPDGDYTDRFALTIAERQAEAEEALAKRRAAKLAARKIGYAQAEKEFAEKLAAEQQAAKSAEGFSFTLLLLSLTLIIDTFPPMIAPFIPPTIDPSQLEEAWLNIGTFACRALRWIKYWVFNVFWHDGCALASLIVQRTPYFAFVMIVLGIQYGITGLLAPIWRYLMYPRHRVLHFPPVVSLLVLFVSVKALFAYLDTPGNLIEFIIKFCNNAYMAQAKKPDAFLHIAKLYLLYIGFTLFPAGYILFKQAYGRFILGRRYAIYDYTDYKLYRRNVPITHIYLPWIIRTILGRLKDLKDARDAYDRKKNRKKIRWDVLPLVFTLTSLPNIANTMTHLTFLENLTNCSLLFFIDFFQPHLVTYVTFLVSMSFEYFTYAPSQLQLVFNFLPEIVLSLAVLVVLANVAVEKLRNTPPKLLAVGAWRNLCKIFVLVAGLYSFQLLFMHIPTLPVFHGYLYLAPGLTFSKLFVLVAALFVLYASESYIREHTRPLVEYPIIIALGVLLLLLLVAANDLMAVFFSLAGFSLSLYILVLFDAEHSPSREAGTKYFYLSTLSAGIILMGAFLIYFLVGSTNYFLIDTFFFSNGVSADNFDVCCVAVVTILLGFFFKLSAFPGHLWAPEVYEGSPGPILAFFVLPVKIAVFLSFLRLLNTAFHEISYIWMPVVFIAAMGSLIWGALAAADSYKITRFLAYASINQIGFMLLGASLDTYGALRATYIYLFLYAVMTGGFMLAYLHIRRSDRNLLIHISDFSGLARTEPSVCWSLAIVLFSMAGIPPLAGFFSKYFVLNAIVARGLTGLAVVAIAISLISAYYYLRIIVTFWFGQAEEKAAPASAELTLHRRVLLVAIEAILWVFCIAGAPLLPEFDLIVWPFWVCG